MVTYPRFQSVTDPAVSTGRSTDVEISAYVARLIKEEEARGTSLRELGRRAGVTHATLSLVANSGRGVGWKTLQGIARAFSKSIGEIEAEARAWARANPGEIAERLPESTVERPERYPNRKIAADFARASGVSDEAVRRIESEDLQSETDPSPEEWLAWMKAEASRMRFGRGGSDRDVDPEETRPRLPPRKK